MQSSFNGTIDTQLNKFARKRRSNFALFLLSVFVILCTLSALMVPASTMDTPVYCGYDEHVHTDACCKTVKTCPYGTDMDTVDMTVPVLGNERGTPVLSGIASHTHTADCFAAQLVCTVPEHTHSAVCYDETSVGAQWLANIEDLTLTGNWAEDLVAIGESQVEEGAVPVDATAEDGTQTEAEQGEYNPQFLEFCFNAAGITEDDFPVDFNSQQWVNELREKETADNIELFASAEEGVTPEPGDIAFFDCDNDGSADKAELISSVDTEGLKLTSLSGDDEGNISETVHSMAGGLSLMAFGLVPENPAEDGVLIIAGSDFQDPKTTGTSGDYTNQKATLSNIFAQIKSNLGEPYAFFAGGDYGFDENKSSTTRTQKGIDAVKSALTSSFDTTVETVFLQGNHDATISDISATGGYTTDYYSYFVINENDYRAYPLSTSKWSDANQSEAKAKAVATQLSTFLKNKADASYDKPIFILSHVPLHFSTRTKAENDGIYAYYIYKAIYDYADNLNVFFLFGHNHAWGDDDYLGGSSVYLPKDELPDGSQSTINIAETGSNSKYIAQPLNFTYMNFGYTGYFWSKWAQNPSQAGISNADSTLTLTTFLIKGNDVTVSRWDANGVHNLKSVGAASQGNRGVAEVCTVTSNSVASPQTVSLSAGDDDDDPGTDDPGTDTPDTPEGNDTGIITDWDEGFAYIREVTSGNAYNNIGSFLGAKASYRLYEFVVKGDVTVPAQGVQVLFPVEKEMRVFGYDKGTLTWYDAEYVTVDKKTYMSFRAPHFSYYGVAGAEEEFVFPDNGGLSGQYWQKVTNANEIISGDTYMVVYNNYAFGTNNNHDRLAEAVTFTKKGTLNGKDYYEVADNNPRSANDGASDYFRFNIVKPPNTSGVYYLMCANENVDDTGLQINKNNLRIDQPSYLKISSVNSGNAWRFKQNENNYYLQYSSGFTNLRGDPGNTTNMTVYHMIDVDIPTNQLAVHKSVTQYNSRVTTDSVFTFLLTAGESADRSDAEFVDATYTVYNPDNTIASENNQLLQGVFKLKPGQTALFEFPQDELNYFVTEQFYSDEIAIESVGATVNGADAAVIYETESDSRLYTATADFDADDRSFVDMTNVPAYIEDYLTLGVNTRGSNDNVPSDVTYKLTVKDTSGNVVSYTKYQLYDKYGVEIGRSKPYNPNSPGIVLGNGQSVRIYGLEPGEFVIEDDYTSVADEVLVVRATIGSNTVSGVMENGIARIPLSYSGITGMNVVNVVGGFQVTFDFTDGTADTYFTDENGTVPYWPSKVRRGMVLQYWSTNPDGTGTIIYPESEGEYVFNQDTVLYANWTTDPNAFEIYARLGKTLDEDAAYNDDDNPENVFDIQLDAYLPPADRAVVLVVDLSSSMNLMCMTCGHMHSGRTSGSTGGTNYDGQSVSYRYENCTFVNRLTVAKAEAKKFIEELSASLSENQDCYVEIVGFAQTAWEVRGDTNLATAAGKQALLDAIDNMNPQSGTNIAAGLKMGYEKLTDIMDSHDINALSTAVILLSDGAPTTNTQAISNGYSDPTSQYYLDCEDALNPAYIAKWQTIWGQYVDDYEWHDTGFNPSASGGKYYNIRQLMSSPYYAEKIRDRGSRLFSVVMGNNLDINTWQSANNYKYVSGIGIDNYEYVRSFSNAAAFTDEQTDLTTFFKDIVDATSIICADGVVTDPMDENVEFLGFTLATGNDMVTDGGFTHEISTDGTKVYHDGTGECIAEYDANTRTVTWVPDKIGTLKYKVRLKNEASGFMDYTATGHEYFTNGETTLDYVVKDEQSGVDEQYRETADIPFVHGWLSNFRFTKFGGYTNDETAHVLSGATFTLSHNPANCPVCRRMDAADRPNIPARTVVSDINGNVFFADLPSGHTYTLSETPPRDYTPACDYLVEVAYGGITVTPTGDDHGYWSGSTDTYRLFNLNTGDYTLPATGGSGTLPYVASGLLMVFIALLGGYFQKNKRKRRHKDSS